MNLMYFRNETFHNGPNVTIRQGDKWSKLNPNEKIELLETGTSNHMGFGIIKDIMVMPFNEVPDYIFDIKYLPMAQSKSFALKDLENMYEDFDPTKVVTVILFDLVL